MVGEFEFFELVADIEQLGRAEAIDEERAIEVVGFVLDDAGHEAVDFAGDFVAVEVVGLDFDFAVASNRRADAGDAEAAFFIFFEAAAGAEDGVDEDAFGIFGVGIAFGVSDEEAVRQIDLVGGEADAFVLVHELEHFVDEFAQVGIDSAQRLRAVAKRGMGILDDLETQRSGRAGGEGCGVGAGMGG